MRCGRVTICWAFSATSRWRRSKPSLAPRRELPFPAFIHQIEETGLTALPIVGLLSFLLGVVLAYQGADQLRASARKSSPSIFSASDSCASWAG